MLRLFFALQPAAAESVTLAGLAAPLIAQLQAQSVPAQNFHATLCFVGAVAPEKLGPLRAAAATVRGRPATLVFDKIEHWDAPKILCATTADGAEAASELVTTLGAVITAAGFPPDIKPFRPHVTLARKVPADSVATASWPLPIEPAIVVHCDRFVLMESRRDSSGSIYSAVDSWPLDS
jgi:2'-5' RNA ligase